MSASTSYDDETAIVPKLPSLERPRVQRAATTQFARPASRTEWPWLLVAVAALFVALAQPIDADRELRLSSQAHELLRALPSQ